MGKYIIELKQGEMAYKTVDSKGTPMIQLLDPIPYTGPDTDAIRKEAYEQGRKDGKIEGQAETWETARKIWEYDTTTLKEIFGEGVMRMDWFMQFTASEAIEKIRAYEQKHEEIKVGDEVITAFGKAVVTGVGPVHFEYVYADGFHGFDKVKNIKKTGRHFPEIVEVLQKMKEAE